MNKEELRRHYRQKRQQLTTHELAEHSAKITELWRESTLANYASYHLFLPIDHLREIDTRPMLEILWHQKRKTYLSKVVGDNLLHYQITEQTTFERSEWGIWEPSNESPISKEELESIDVVFVPLLIADRAGHRVGYGKGYYDRFLMQIPQAITIGLSSFPLIDAIADVEAHDIPLDFIITPEKIHLID